MIPSDFLIALVAALLLTTATGLSLLGYRRAAPMDSKTEQVIRVIGGFFVVMTSLLISLLINSAKNNFETINQNVHKLATEVILLDRDLRQGGDAALESRRALERYVQRVLERTWPKAGETLVADREAELILDDLDRSLRGAGTEIKDGAAWNALAARHLDRIVELRWSLIAAADGTIPIPVVAMVIVWLTLAFANFSYAAPRNSIVILTLLIAGIVATGSTFILLDMDRPFDGLIGVSPAPLQRAAEILHR